MKGISKADLLVKQTQELERLRVLVLAEKCQDIQELRGKLSELLEKKYE